LQSRLVQLNWNGHFGCKHGGCNFDVKEAHIDDGKCHHNFALAEVHWEKLRPITWNSFGETKAIL
jgi:hypothetical protein